MGLYRYFYEHETNLFHSFRLLLLMVSGSVLVILQKEKSQSRGKIEDSASCTGGFCGDFSVSLRLSERSRETVCLFSVLI